MTEQEAINVLHKIAALKAVDPDAFAKDYKRKWVRKPGGKMAPAPKPVVDEEEEEKNAGYRLGKAIKQAGILGGIGKALGSEAGLASRAILDVANSKFGRRAPLYALGTGAALAGISHFLPGNKQQASGTNTNSGGFAPQAKTPSWGMDSGGFVNRVKMPSYGTDSGGFAGNRNNPFMNIVKPTF